MKSANRPYLYPVDHLRAFAAVLVLLYHSIQLISQAASPEHGWQPDRWLHSDNPLLTLLLEGHTGVALFMVLSGFIFTIGTLDREVAYWPFLRNRVLRIYPLYILLLMVGVAATPGPFDLTMFVRNLLPLGTLGPDLAGPWGAMFWAVGVEMQFYLLFPLLLRLLQRGGPMALVRIIATMAVLRGVAWWVTDGHVDVHELTYASLVGRLDQFLLGMLAGWLFTRGIKRWQGVASLVGGGVAILGMLWLFNRLTGYFSGGLWRMWWVDAEGLAWAAVILGTVIVFRERRGWLSRALAAVGERSYSIYLLHFVIVMTVVSHPGAWIRIGGPVSTGLATGLLVVLPAVLVLSWLTYASIERPFLKMRGPYIRSVLPTAEPSTTP